MMNELTYMHHMFFAQKSQNALRAPNKRLILNVLTGSVSRKHSTLDGSALAHGPAVLSAPSLPAQIKTALSVNSRHRCSGRKTLLPFISTKVRLTPIKVKST